MLDKSIVDLNGNIIYSHILMDENNNILFSDIEIKITKDMQIVDMYDKTYAKPKWTGMEWVESATEEEIKEWDESNKPKESTEVEILQKQLLETQAIVANLQEQILLNGGIK